MYESSLTNVTNVTPDTLHAVAADIEYVWTEYVDEDVAELAYAAIAALRALAHRISPEEDEV